MGAVYQAWDDELMVSVAIKTILPDAEASENETHAAEVRFKRELLLARQVTHKNVVRIHDLGEVEGQKYITMSFIEGETLAALLKRAGPLPVPQALSFARQIADGLAAAHEVGVVHRDLKPENIMITPDGHRHRLVRRPEEASSCPAPAARRLPHVPSVQRQPSRQPPAPRPTSHVLPYRSPVDVARFRDMSGVTRNLRGQSSINRAASPHTSNAGGARPACHSPRVETLQWSDSPP